MPGIETYCLLARQRCFNGLKIKGLAITVLGLVAVAAGGRANAGCVDSPNQQAAPTTISGSHRFLPAVYRPDASDAALLGVSDVQEDASIVGLWEFKFTGFIQGFGTQALHAGGTETTFSGGVNPSVGNVCQGVWRKVGPSTYTLHHIVLAWTAPGAQYGLLIEIHARLELDKFGNTFSGPYTVSLYSETPQDPFDKSAPPFVSAAGTLTAQRVQPD